jgi:hypothetical protein
VSHEVLKNSRRGSLDIGVSPVNPRVVGSQGSTEEPVTGLGHGLSAGSLGGESVTVLDVLLDLLTEILLDEGNVSERHSVIRVILEVGKVLLELRKSLVLGVRNQEGKVDQVVGVGEVSHVGEEHGKMSFGITKRDTEEDTLAAFPTTSSSEVVVEVIMADGAETWVVCEDESQS